MAEWHDDMDEPAGRQDTRDLLHDRSRTPYMLQNRIAFHTLEEIGRERQPFSVRDHVHARQSK